LQRIILFFKLTAATETTTIIAVKTIFVLGVAKIMRGRFRRRYEKVAIKIEPTMSFFVFYERVVVVGSTTYV
jgi:hypothetical protein